MREVQNANLIEAVAKVLQYGHRARSETSAQGAVELCLPNSFANHVKGCPRIEGESLQTNLVYIDEFFERTVVTGPFLKI